MSQRALNPQLFHGSSKPLEKVLPPSEAKAGTPNSSRLPMSESVARGAERDPYFHASATSSERHAWEFAGMTAQRVGGRATVFHVTAPPDMKRGAEPKEVLSATGFDVVGAEHIRPPETVRKPGKNMRYHVNPNGRQGTLPLDWTPAGRHNSGSMSSYAAAHGDNYNHPTQRARVFEAKRIEEQEALRTPEAPKAPLRRIKGQMELPGMRQKRQ